MKFFLLIAIIIVGFCIGMLAYRVTELEVAYVEKCDTWNIALAKEQADGSVDIQYVRVCKEDYEALSTIISK